ncbi:MAG: hypothetical protein ACJ795_06080 [Ktedonobacteraceae bacterium]
MLQFNLRIRSETPLDHGSLSVARLLTRSDFLTSLPTIADAPVQTVVNQDSYFDFDPLHSTPVERRIMPFHLVCQAEHFWEGTRFRQSGGGLDMQISENMSPFGSRGLFLVQQGREAVGEIPLCSCFFHQGMTPPSGWFKHEEDAPRTMARTLCVLAGTTT